LVRDTPDSQILASLHLFSELRQKNNKSMMNLEILDSHDPRWLKTLQRLRHDVYHLPAYVEIEAKRSQAKAEAILVTEGENCLFIPYLLRNCRDIVGQAATEDFFDVISPYGYAGFLLHEATDNSANFANLAFQQVKQAWRIKGVCAAFMRLHPILDAHCDGLFEAGTFVDNGETVSVDLTLSAAEMWQHTRKGHKSTIKKCEKLDLSVKIVPFSDRIDEFMSIYSETMNRVVAKESYYFDFDYFLALSKLNDRLQLGIVELDRQTICVGLFFECCGIVQWHLGGTRTDFLSYSPSNLLLHHVRLWAKERGNEFLHLGGGIGGSKEDRLYIFKSGFSQQRHQFKTARLIINEEKYQQLVDVRSKLLAISASQLIESGFFPAYRAELAVEEINLTPLHDKSSAPAVLTALV
jgi:Acetyltransferase (GNAT) domain